MTTRGLYVYYVMRDFTPYLGSVPVVEVLLGLGADGVP